MDGHDGPAGLGGLLHLVDRLSERKDSMDNLKRCPFCGGEAEAVYRYNRYKRVWFSFVRCTICSATGHSYAQDTAPDDDDPVWEKVAGAWNMRTPE